MELFYTEQWKPLLNSHSTLNSHNHPMRKVLLSQFYRIQKGGLKKLYILPKGHIKLERQGSNSGFKNWFFFFSIKGQMVNIFGSVAHMVSVAIIHPCSCYHQSSHKHYVKQ